MGALHQGLHAFQDILVRGRLGEVGDFLGIIIIIVKLDAIFAIGPFSVAIALGANSVALQSIATLLARHPLADSCDSESCLANGSLWVSQYLYQTVAF